jgi:hypothetical protein
MSGASVITTVRKKALRMQALADPPLKVSAVTWRYAITIKCYGQIDGRACSHDLRADGFELGIAIHSSIDANPQRLVCLVYLVETMLLPIPV